jgi:hypothetical protein
MMRRVFSFRVVLAMTLGIFLSPILTSAAEFSFAGPPAFTVTYPDGSKPTEKDSPVQVWAIKTPDEVVVQAAVAPIPEGIGLQEVAEKVYKPGLETYAKAKVTVIANDEIILKDGTKANFTALEWEWQNQATITTVMVSAYKNGKWVYATAHPWMSPWEPMRIVKSLRFK